MAATSQSGAFSLTSSASAGGARAWEHYSAVYGTKMRAMQRWLAIGKQAGDPPPLDDPVALAERWWPKHMKWAVPPKLQAAAARARAGEPLVASPSPANDAENAADTPPAVPPAGSGSIPSRAQAAPKSPSAPTPTAPAPPAPSLDPINYDSVEAMTLSDLLDALRLNASVLISQQRAAAQKGYNRDAFAAFQRDISNITEQIRKTERSIEEIRLKRGELIDKAHARDEIQRVHTAMAMSLPTELRREFGVTQDRAMAFVNRWFLHLRSSELTAGTEPAPVDPPPLAAAA